MTDSLSFFTSIGLDDIYKQGRDPGNYLKDKVVKRVGAECPLGAEEPRPGLRDVPHLLQPLQGQE